MLQNFVIRESREARDARVAAQRGAAPPSNGATATPPRPRRGKRSAPVAKAAKAAKPAKVAKEAHPATPRTATLTQAARAARPPKLVPPAASAPPAPHAPTAPADERHADAFAALCRGVATTLSYESMLRGRVAPTAPADGVADVEQVLDAALDGAVTSRARARAAAPPDDDLSDAALSQYARFTHQIALAPYAPFLHYVPRLVNVVTLAEALPVPGAGMSLPLDLKRIASRCTGAFYAPRRFAAVQLAYSNPRCRVLVFHTGRLVGTGTTGAMAARLAILRAQRQLSEQADVHLKIRSFQVINQVGASALRATLNCDGFAAAHSGTSHFDRASFVGLAWRPPNESICCEIYSTGRANLPGSVAERQLLGSFSRMLPELLRYSSASALLAKIPEAQQAHHRVAAKASDGEGPARPPSGRAPRADVDLWADWGRAEAAETEAEAEAEAPPAELDDATLAALGM